MQAWVQGGGRGRAKCDCGWLCAGCDLCSLGALAPRFGPGLLAARAVPATTPGAGFIHSFIAHMVMEEGVREAGSSRRRSSAAAAGIICILRPAAGAGRAGQASDAPQSRSSRRLALCGIVQPAARGASWARRQRTTSTPTAARCGRRSDVADAGRAAVAVESSFLAVRRRGVGALRSGDGMNGASFRPAFPDGERLSACRAGWQRARRACAE